MTADHSVVQVLLNQGQITAATGGHLDRHVITRAVGLSDQFLPDFWLHPLEPGERLLLCSGA